MFVLRELLEQQESAARARFTFLECDAVIRIAHKYRDIPKQYRRCPYCGGPIAIHFESWTKNDDGTWSADHAKADCLTEPSMRTRKFDESTRRRGKNADPATRLHFLPRREQEDS